MRTNLDPKTVFPIYGHLILPSFEEATMYMKKFVEIYDKNKVLTVKDVYDVLGITLFQQHRSHLFGWFDVNKIQVMRVVGGKGCLYIPERVSLL